MARGRIVFRNKNAQVSSGGGGERSLLTLSDLTWDGEYRVDNPGGAVGLQGRPVSDSCPLAILYVESAGACADARRFLMPNYSAVFRTATVAATNPAQLTVTDHGFATDSYIRVMNSNPVTVLPAIAGTYKVTSTGTDTFTIPVDLSAGTGGTAYATQYPNTWGDIVEWGRPAATSYYTGPSPESAPALMETGRWDGVELTDVMNLSGDIASGNFIGGMYVDENHVLWLNIYGYYYGNNMPSLMAVQLTHTAHPTRSGYFQVGTRYGPWYYRSSTPGNGDTQWKGANHGFMPIPASAQADLGGRTMIRCGSVGAVGGAGHWGLGFRAIDFPAVATTPNTVQQPSDNSGLGLKLAEYSEEFGTSPIYACRRDDNYTQPSFGPEHILPASGLWAPDPASNPSKPGYWQASMDQTNGAVWVETDTKHGILSFGRQVYGQASYGYSPISETFRTIRAISNVGTTVTVTMNSHNMNTGTMVRISGVYPNGYNGTFSITKIDNDHFSYTSTGTLGTASFEPYITPVAGIATGTGSAVVTTSAPHNLATGMMIGVDANVDAQITPGVYLQGSWYQVTVIDSTHFSIPVSIAVAGTAVGNVRAATHSSGVPVVNFTPEHVGDWYGIAIGWDASVFTDYHDPGRGDGASTGNTLGYTNGFCGQHYRGIIRIMDPMHIRGVAQGVYSATSVDTNWDDLGDWRTQWPNIPEYRGKNSPADADESRVCLLSQNTHGMAWDPIAKQVVWVQSASASDAFTTNQITPTVQFISVP